MTQKRARTNCAMLSAPYIPFSSADSTSQAWMRKKWHSAEPEGV